MEAVKNCGHAVGYGKLIEQNRKKLLVYNGCLAADNSRRGSSQFESPEQQWGRKEYPRRKKRGKQLSFIKHKIIF